MTWDAAPAAIQSASPALIGFLALCLVITCIGAVVRAVTGAVNGGDSDSDD